MSAPETRNSTPLKIGMSGPIDGRACTVVGRVVYRVEDGGETYTWQEFNLVNTFGHAATLVYEEMESGPEWKLFSRFEPLRELTPAAAARKKTGDTVNLDGTDVRVTFTGRSRALLVEGTPPPGVVQGEESDYFNAEAGGRMLVVSWTGTKLECYQRRDFSSGQLAALFGLPVPRATPESSTFGRFARPQLDAGVAEWLGSSTGVWVILVALIAFFIAVSSCSTDETTQPPPARVAAAPRVLANGAHGRWQGRDYTVVAHVLAAVAEVTGRYERREYELRDQEGQQIWLMQGLAGEPRRWIVGTPIALPAAYTPLALGALRAGARLSVAGQEWQVQRLFECRFLEGVAGLRPGVELVCHGFLARGPKQNWLLVRWTEGAVQAATAEDVAEPALLRAFGVKTEHD